MSLLRAEKETIVYGAAGARGGSRSALIRRWFGRDAGWGYLFVAPQIVGLLVFVVGPVAASLLMGFLDINMVTMDYRWVGLGNYEALLADRTFRMAVVNTLYFTAVSVPLNIVISLLVALALSQGVRFENGYRALYFMPTVTSSVVIAVVWGWLLNPEFGLVNQVLSLLGIHGPGWIGSMEWAMPSVILVAVWHGVGYNMVIFLAGLKNISRELYEAAKVDGASALQRFRFVTVPMVSPTTFFILIMAVIGSFQVFNIVFMMTRGGPADSTQVLLLRMYQVGFQFLKLGQAAAISWILFALILAATLLQFRGSRWVHYG